MDPTTLKAEDAEELVAQELVSVAPVVSGPAVVAAASEDVDRTQNNLPNDLTMDDPPNNDSPHHDQSLLISEHEEESEYEYEEEDDAFATGFLESTVTTDEETTTQKWREPSQEAVDMSLRAERETTGGKRRLAADLYKIMTSDTLQAGFTLKPSSEDSMDKWTISLVDFDADSNLAQDLAVLGLTHVELEMTFPDDYPFAPPFVRVVRPKFKKQTGFVMNGALCMELLTKEGWNPVNDIESVIVSIRSLLVVGDGRLQAAVDLGEQERARRLALIQKNKRARDDEEQEEPAKKIPKTVVGSYTMAEAQAAYSHLSEYHKKKGWDTSGWWKKKG
jgi:ubiquitin-conjugating enzyme E2 Q